MAAAKIREGLQDKLFLGNLAAQRDWGFAGDFVEGMWRMVQADAPGDYVLCTGEMHTVREFCLHAFARAGIELDFRGQGVDEVGVHVETGKTVVAIDPGYFRPTEVDLLLGDYSKAKKALGWSPRVTFDELVNMMVDADLLAVQRGEPFNLDPSLEIMRAVLA
jgi:GDPmannose 4,6-dehydratase